MTPIPVLPPRAAQSILTPLHSDSKLREAAVALEATFLSEMLKSAGFGENHTQFSGGVGEENFQSFLRDAQARNIAENGGIGLAQALFEALKVRQDA